MLGTFRVQKREVDYVKLELEIVVRYHVGAGK